MSALRKSNNSSWKNMQPPMQQDPAIVSYQTTPAMLNISNARETGVVEKLLHSYGFIQCYERDARLFFHFSEYHGDMNAIKVGDGVEFLTSSDKRTGRPVACSVNKVAGETISYEVYSEERYSGSIVQEAKPKNKDGSREADREYEGRVTYEHNGEWFFIPYCHEDIVNDSRVKCGDQVTFILATDKRNREMRARQLELVQLQKNKKFQGVVCSLKESFGFIERSDVVKEIFFHYSEYRGDIGDINLGDDVEFDVQVRNNKEVAVNISKLPEGTVVFEDISVDKYRGKLKRTLKSNRRHSDPFGGLISYTVDKKVVEIAYGDKDQDGDYTLRVDDVVEFSISTDRRDKLQRATDIKLCRETFENTEERRVKGIISVLKDGYGFIDSADRESRLFFHFSELIDKKKDLKVQENVEFTVVEDPSTSDGKQMAIRILYLPKGSVSLYTLLPEKYIGTIDREPSIRNNSAKNKDESKGNIIFDYEGKISHIAYSSKDLRDSKDPHFGDKVEFQICEVKRNNSKYAVNIKVIFRNVSNKRRGYVAALQDTYGFVENSDHNQAVFFHFTSLNGSPSEIEIGDEVEYTITKKGAKFSAENVSRIPSGTIPEDAVIPGRGVLYGTVKRSLKIVNPEQDEYFGLIQVISDDGEDSETIPFGITSLVDRKEIVQRGDSVEFLVAETHTGCHHAVHVTAVRKYVQSKVDTVKEQFGYIDYEMDEGKKLYFKMSEVLDEVVLQPGDDVKFVIIQNQRSGRYSACSVRKVIEKPRPERLLSRLRSVQDDKCGPRLIAVRQPRGPDDTLGFKLPRVPWVQAN
ncbi:hypothetical protein FSP39_009267 [Pinctada imbricata]|uniref:Cold shock domain-containing protein E1 n=1 Tax=Pinctada imbricata TaxID=66713 RepID=A0AA88XY20_PINIB|nr:hypothetical protein FSP39_009267 [Pinctada imbricata]